MNCFFIVRKKGVEKKLIIACILFFTVISAEYLFIDIPLLTICLNLVGIYILTLFYDATNKRRIIYDFFIFSSMVVVESFIMLFSSSFTGSMLESSGHTEILSLILCAIFQFWMVIVFSNHKRYSPDVRLPASYWISVISIPISFIIIDTVFHTIINLERWQYITVQAVIFVMNIGAFILFEKQLQFFQKENETNLIATQNQYYKQQIESIKENDDSLQMLRHDLKNHILAIKTIANNDNNSALINYIDNLYDMTQIKSPVNSGNIIIDGILSNKYRVANTKNIQINTVINIPDNIAVDDTDIAIILGNITDNAIENTTGDIDLKINYTPDNSLMIECRNPFEGKLKKQNHRFITTKKNPGMHGLGLKNIERTLEKYDGFLECTAESNIFTIKAILKLKRSNGHE